MQQEAHLMLINDINLQAYFKLLFYDLMIYKVHYIVTLNNVLRYYDQNLRRVNTIPQEFLKFENRKVGLVAQMIIPYKGIVMISKAFGKLLAVVPFRTFCTVQACCMEGQSISPLCQRFSEGELFDEGEKKSFKSM